MNVQHKPCSGIIIDRQSRFYGYRFAVDSHIGDGYTVTLQDGLCMRLVKDQLIIINF